MRIGEFNSSDLTKAIQVILDCFTGADGGISFADTCNFLRQLDNKAIAGDTDAREITAIVIRFAKLIQLATKR